MSYFDLPADWLTLAGLLAAVVIGFSLGVIGCGGSILTVPVLVYLLHIPPSQAVSNSLFIVGLTSLLGVIRLMKQKLVNYQAALEFFIPSTIVVFLTRHLIVPALPAVVLSYGRFQLTKDAFTLVLFAILMLLSASSMIRQQAVTETSEDSRRIGYIFAAGLLVGLLTGLVGAGGGFLIIPALVLFAHLPMKMAVGTSLLIIAANSLMGFTGDIIGGTSIHWYFLLLFSALAVAGIFLGMYIASFVSSARLKPLFGWFVLLMGFYILCREFL